MLFSLSSRLWQVRLFAVTIFASLGSALLGQLNQPSAGDGFDPNANGVVNVALAQRDGKIVLGGSFTTLRPNGASDNVDRNALARVNTDGSLDFDFNPNANGQVYAMALQSAGANAGKIIVAGAFTSVGGVTRNRIARLNTDGTVDSSFNVDLAGGLAPEVYALIVLPDDRIVIGGAFTTVGGVTRNRIARLSANGALDTTYDPNASAAVLSLAVQRDGKIILGGSFTSFQPAGDSSATTRRYLARLNPSGTVDTEFDPKPDNTVRAIAVQVDGAILLGGNFGGLQPTGSDAAISRSRIARLNPDGSLDAFYSPNANAQVSAFALQPDGRLLVGGNFTQLVPNGGATVSRSFVARLNADGTVDLSFQTLSNAAVNAIALQTDGRVVVGGAFTQLRAAAVGTVPVNRNRVARLNIDGSPDTALDPAASGLVLVQAVQSDGKVVVGGTFTLMGGLTRNYIARLNTDGTVDGSFSPALNAPVQTIGIQSDQKILIGGTFTNIGGVTRNYLARLNADGSLDNTFNPSPTNQVNSLAIQTDGKILLAGAFTSLSPEGGSSVVRNHLARLTAAGAVDTTFDPNSDSAPNVITLQSDQKILVGGSFNGFTPNGGTGVARTNMARLNTDGTVDTTFEPQPNGAVLTQVVQADGKIVIGGSFVVLNPKGGAGVIRYYIARLNADGTLDTGYNPRASDTVASLALQADGKVLVGGLFSFLRPGDDVAKNAIRNRIARLNVDGTVDTGFDPNAGGQVATVVYLASGKIIMGGGFTSLKPAGKDLVLARNRIVRLNSDGTVDASFDPSVTTQSAGSIEVVATQSDGKLIVAGGFNNFSGSRSSNLARFGTGGDADATFLPNADGPVSTVLVQPSRTSVPTANVFAWFNPDSTLRASFKNSAVAQLSGQINAVLAQADGKIIVAGNFTNKAGTTGNYLLRLKTDGTFDPTFNPGPAGEVNAIALQSDGKLVIGGSFDSVGGATRYRIARLNTDGSVDTGYNPYAGDVVYALAIQSDGKVIVGGAFTTFQPNGASTTTARSFLARLNTDGTLDTAYNPTPSALVRALVIQPADGKLIVGGDFNSFQPNSATTATTRNFIARLNTDATLDTEFDPNANAAVYAIALQSYDNKPVIGGAFGLLQPANGGAFVRSYIARLNTNGSVDSNFNPSPNNAVRAVAVSSDGSILLGGTFTALQPGSSFYPVARSHIALVGSDGALNTGFNPSPAGDVLAIASLADGSVLAGGSFTSLTSDANLIVGGNFKNIGGTSLAYLAQLDGAGSAVPGFAPNPNGAVNAIVQQPDTKLIVGGSFTAIAGLPRNRLARVTTDGVLDATFNADVTGTVNALALQSDGRLVVGGAFTAITGTARSNLARVNADGSIEASFNPQANGQINALLLRPNGQIVVAGSFTSLGGQTRNRLARLNADGSVDASFNPNVNGTVFSIVASVDGKIILGGTFTSVSGVGRNNVARLNADGSLDASFDPNADGSVFAVALQPEGGVVLGGAFNAVTGQSRFRLARLAVGNAAAAQLISASSNRTTLTWTRTGGGAELSAARFEISTDAITWTLLGAATRVGVTSNWQLTGLSLAADSTFYVRALGSAPTSKNTSAGLVRSEQIFNFAQTPIFGTDVVVGAVADQAFRYAASNGKAAAYTAAGLPAGLKIDAATGVITGTPTETGTYNVVVTATNAGGNVSAALLLNIGGTGSAASGQSIRLINLSALAQVGTNGTAITGFVSTGGTVLIRAIGPGLSAFGVSGVLTDPVLRIYDAAGALVTSNNDWSGSDISSASVATGAFPLAANSKDAALLLNLAPGGYTALVTNADARGGALLTEIYDANGTTLTPRFRNLSARAPVAPGSPLVGGFVITATDASGTQKVLVRGVGPGLTKFNVANALADPVLKVYDASGRLIATSNDWSGTDVAAAAVATGAFALEAGSKDAALLLTLAPGGYTFEITAAPNSAGGEALADIYAAP